MTTCIDSHAHLDAEEDNNHLEDILTRAHQAGVSHIINVASNIESTRKCIELAVQHSNLFATAGIHPHDVSHAQLSDLTVVEELAGHERVVGIGETGLDYHYDFSPPSEQRIFFSKTVEIAHRLHKPLIIHIREAHEDARQILQSSAEGTIKGVVHCFTGNLEQAKQYVTMGLYLSFSGILTFPKAEEIRQAAAWAPLDRILCETDSPYLAPIPHRGKRNEPAFVIHTLQALAQLRQLPLKEMARITSHNTQVLFSLPI